MLKQAGTNGKALMQGPGHFEAEISQKNKMAGGSCGLNFSNYKKG